MTDAERQVVIREERTRCLAIVEAEYAYWNRSEAAAPAVGALANAIHGIAAGTPASEFAGRVAQRGS